jgi:hypothetical protein
MDSTRSSISASSERAFRLPFLTAFFVLTLLPLAQMTLNLPSAPPIDERRTLAPTPQAGWRDPFRWVTEADAWFSDHFGFRSALIRTKTQIDYSLFHTSSRIYIGADNQLFYRSVMDVEKPAAERFLKARKSDIVDNVRTLHSALAGRGIRLALSVNLLADRYLPEKLPASAPRYTGPQQIDDLIAQLGKSLGPDFFDLTPTLLEAARKHPIFHKTDFHWNNPAAAAAGKMIVNRWSTLLGRAPLWTREIAVRSVRFSGGMARFMPLFVTPEETTLDIDWNFSAPAGLQSFSNEGIFESGHRIPDSRPDLLPTLVMLGDSFSDGYLVAGLPIYFQNFYRVRWGAEITISRVIESLPDDTRLLLIQFVETETFVLNALADKADVSRAIALIEKRAPASKGGDNVAR